MSLKVVYRFVVASAAALLGGCLSSDADLDEHQFRCESSDDCGSGWQCDQTQRFCIAAYAGENGVFADRIVLGMSAPIDKAPLVPGAERIGRAVRNGINAYFSHVNRTGGIHGRRLELRVADDNYLPDTTERLVGELLQGDDRQVFALVSVIGTDPSLRARDIANDRRVLFFAPGSGADKLEPPTPDRYIFNFRPRYSEEVEQLVEYMTQTAEPPVGCSNVAVFTSDDGAGNLSDVGQSGEDGAASALRRLCDIPRNDVVIGTFPRNTIEVDAAVSRLLRWAADPARKTHAEPNGTIALAIVMLPTFDAGGAFVKRITDQIAAVKRNDGLSGVESKYGNFTESELVQLAKVRLRFGTSSNVGLILAQGFAGLGAYQTKEDGQLVDRPYGAGTIFASSVPSVTSGVTGVDAYRTHLEQYKQEVTDKKLLSEAELAEIGPDPFSLEGYLVSVLLGKALISHGRDLTTESFIDTLESLQNVSLDVGPSFGFSSNSHQALKKLWGLRLSETFSFEEIGLLVD